MIEISFCRNNLDLFTVNDAKEKIQELFPGMTPEQEFKVTAIIKRLVHYEKRCTYERLSRYYKMSHESPVKFYQELLDGKLETHAKLSHDPDEEIVTWSVGSHTYKQ